MKTDGGLRPIFRKHLPSVHWVSVETGLIERGVPDLNGCVDGIEFWIENKKTNGFAVKIRADQIGWHKRRARAGGLSFIAVRRMVAKTKRRPATDELWLWPGAGIVELSNRGLLKATGVLTIQPGGPAHWDWAEIVSIFKSFKV